MRADGANGLRDGGFLLVCRKLLDVGELLGRELRGRAEGFESALLGPSSLGPSLVLAGPEVSDGFASILPSAAFASILPSPGVALAPTFSGWHRGLRADSGSAPGSARPASAASFLRQHSPPGHPEVQSIRSIWS